MCVCVCVCGWEGGVEFECVGVSVGWGLMTTVNKHFTWL